MESGKNLILEEGITEACEYIRKVYKDYDIEIPPSSWLWQNLDASEHIGKGHRLSVPPNGTMK